MPERSKLVSLKIRNLGCVGPEGLTVELDNIVCLVGRNNTGKSTVLRAYELAQGNQAITEQERCHWTPPDDFPEVELMVHVPDGTMNVDDKWKIKIGDLKLVRSRWQWKIVGEKPVRETWDPEANEGKGAWGEEKAGGADNVFKSRLPQPLRVGSLGDSIVEHDQLLKLIIEPVASELRQLQETVGSPLHQAVQGLVQAANKPVQDYQDAIDKVGTEVGKGFKGVFPELDVKVRVSFDTFTIDPTKELTAGSSIRFVQGESDTGIKQQGTGSRRALFWTLLQVRNLILRERKVKAEQVKAVAAVKEKIESGKGKIEKEQKKLKPNEEKINQWNEEIKLLEQDEGAVDDHLALPGHILLIDEPENALHPMAVRAAREHLYSLARDPNWQVMLSTHSPYFIDPLEDHTTILRLERNGKLTTPRTYRTHNPQFSEDDKANLRALLQLDNALNEMFFGSYPIIVEGDTELAAFMAACTQDDDGLATQIRLVPALGKARIVSMIRLLAHFKVPFGVTHDTDSPFWLNKKGEKKKNSAWTENKTIADAICQAREKGIVVRHRISIPDFERRLGGLEESKDKPILAYRKVLQSPEVRNLVKKLFMELLKSEQLQSIENLTADSTSDQIVDALKGVVVSWAEKEAPDDLRFKFEI